MPNDLPSWTLPVIIVSSSITGLFMLVCCYMYYRRCSASTNRHTPYLSESSSGKSYHEDFKLPDLATNLDIQTTIILTDEAKTTGTQTIGTQASFFPSVNEEKKEVSLNINDHCLDPILSTNLAKPFADPTKIEKEKILTRKNK